MYQMRTQDELYEEFIKCYEDGTPLSHLKSEAESFNVFKLKKGLPVKYISTKDPIKLPMDDYLIGADGFYRKHKGFYLIPNDFKGKIISFVLRGLSHDYHDANGMSNIRPLFGWYTFTDFKQNEPVILTEGSKDCIILQQYYPYTLALLTSDISIANLNIIKAITNKVILAYDKDKAGISGIEKDKIKLEKLGIQVKQISPRLKDFGTDYKDSNYLKELIYTRVKGFSKLGGILNEESL